MPNQKISHEEKLSVIEQFIMKRMPSVSKDRYGNLVYSAAGNKYRFKIKQRTIRRERQVDLGDKKEWMLVQSYNFNQMYERAINDQN